MKINKIKIFLVLFFIISSQCMAEEGSFIFINTFFGKDYYYINRDTNKILDLSSFGLGVGFKNGSRLETGLLSEYNLSKLLRIRPYIDLRLTGISFLGIYNYIGLSGLYSTDFNSFSFGISPELGIEFWFLKIGFNFKLQYDIHKNNKYNCFIASCNITIPIIYL